MEKTCLPKYTPGDKMKFDFRVQERIWLLRTDEGMWLIRGHAGRTPLRNVEEHQSEEQECKFFSSGGFCTLQHHFIVYRHDGWWWCTRVGEAEEAQAMGGLRWYSPPDSHPTSIVCPLCWFCTRSQLLTR